MVLVVLVVLMVLVVLVVLVELVGLAILHLWPAAASPKAPPETDWFVDLANFHFPTPLRLNIQKDTERLEVSTKISSQ
jgi:Na+-transporting methylmalonyl-CoA/oxaloacetate decarboxylase gamma subunit